MYPGASLWPLLPPLLLALSLCLAAEPGSWGDWVVLDEAEPGTSILLRRITPKSVFVAPTFSCSEGYRQDALGRCIKHVKVNQAEQWKFYLERLNSMYAPAASSKKPLKEAGPFHISLPIGSESSQEDVVVKKRLPPIRDQIFNSTSTSTSTTTEATTTTAQQPTTTTYLPTTTMQTTTTVQESTLAEITQPTAVDTTEATGTEKDFNSQPEITTESRRKYETTELYDSAVMLGDQPIGTENFTEVETSDTPKNKQNPSQPTDKPFVIIVTSEPATKTEEPVYVPVTAFTTPMSETEGKEVISESPTTTEVTTETTSRYTTDSTEYDERLSEVRDTAPTVRYASSSQRPPCDPRAADYDDCEPAETEVVSHKRVVVGSAPLPPSMPLQEPHTRVRFPSEHRQPSPPPPPPHTQYVRFPERAHPHDDRPGLWYPSWQVRSHPAIGRWPPSDSESMDMLHKQYPPYPQAPPSWSNTPPMPWRRRFF